jgi:flagellar hook-associated protein 1 FlgK
MGLTTSLSHALTGLRSIETGLETVSRNIANSGVEGYARRRVSPRELASGGVISTDVQRELDTVLQRHMRAETSAAAATGVAATYLARLDESFGPPGGVGSLDTLFNGLATSLQTLASEPANPTARLSVTGAAQALASALNQASETVQNLRADADASLADATGEANAALQTLEASERELAFARFGNARADLLDTRDKALDTLSRLMDIRISPRGDGAVSVYTSGGLALFTGKAARISIENGGALTPQSSGSTVIVTGPDGGDTALTPGLAGPGEFAGLMTMRDRTLPAMQQGLDSIAAGLATATQTAGVPLFVDAGNGAAVLPYTGGAQETGFAGRIAVDPALLRNPAPLAPNGSPANARALVAALTETQQTFTSPIAGASAFSGDAGAAIRHLLDRQGVQAAEATRVNEGQLVVVNGLAERFAETSGVSVDQEMAQLVELQNAYAANARIISAVQDMYDALLNI